MMCPTKDKQNAKILLEYCAGTLDPDRALEFEKHAAECAAARAKRQADCQFTFATNSPCQNQVSHIATRNHEDQYRGCKQHQQHIPGA